MLATPESFRKQMLAAVIGMVGLTGMTRNAPAQCQLQKLTADGAYFSNTAVHGDTAVIGAPWGNSGSAYVFQKLNGVWTQTAKLTADDGASGDRFGSVSVSGNTAVIGAWNDGNTGPGYVNGHGSAYVFENLAGVWTQSAKLTAADGAPNDFFGGFIAFSADTAVIGASNDGNTAHTAHDGHGSAYVFEKGGVAWTQTAKLTAADGVAGDHFGQSIAISGSTAVIGAPWGNSGSAYVFQKLNGVWTQTAKLTADDGAAGDWFGSSVAVSGDTAVIGASQFTNGAVGAAYLFEKVGVVWTQTAKLTVADGVAGDYFGSSVAMNGSTAVIVAPYGNPASAYVFSVAVACTALPDFADFQTCFTGTDGGILPDCEVFDLDGDGDVDLDDYTVLLPAFTGP